MFEVATPRNGEPVTLALPGSGEPRAAGAAARRLGQGVGITLLGGVIAVMAAIVAMDLVPPRYTATLALIVEPSSGGGEAATTDGVDPAMAAEREMRLLQSDAVLGRVIERLDLVHDDAFTRPDSASPLLQGLKRSFGFGPDTAQRTDLAHTLALLRDHLDVRRAEPGAIDVTVRSSDPEQAARIANAIGDAHRSLAAETPVARTARNAAGLSTQLSALRAAVEEAEKSLAEARAERPPPPAAPSTPAPKPPVDRAAGEQARALAAATAQLAAAQGALARTKNLATGPAGLDQPDMVRSRSMQRLRERYTALSRAVADLEGQLGERHPTLREGRAELLALDHLVRSRTEREKDRLVEAAEAGVERAEAARNAALRKARQTPEQAKIEPETAPSRPEPDLTDRVPQLERDLGASRAAYEAALAGAQVTEPPPRPEPRLRVLAAAVPPVSREWPPSPTIVLPTALAIGMVLGAILALVASARRERLARAASGGARSFRAADA